MRTQCLQGPRYQTVLYAGSKSEKVVTKREVDAYFFVRESAVQSIYPLGQLLNPGLHRLRGR